MLNWRDKALFGLIRGQSRWQLKKHARGGRGMWLSNRLRPKTLVTLDQEVTGRSKPGAKFRFAGFEDLSCRMLDILRSCNAGGTLQMPTNLLLTRLQSVLAMLAEADYVQVH